MLYIGKLWKVVENMGEKPKPEPELKEVTYTWKLRFWSLGKNRGYRRGTLVITVPKFIQEKLGLKAGDLVEITLRKVG